MKIYYFHGFSSEFKPHSDKLQALRDKYPDAEFPAHTYYYHQTDWVDKLTQVKDEISAALDQGEEVKLYGTSLGGYLAQYIGRVLGLKYVIFNPSYDPMTSLNKYVDDQGLKLFTTGEPIQFTKDHLDVFRSLEKDLERFPHDPDLATVFIGLQDETIPAGPSIAFYQARGIEPITMDDCHRFKKNFVKALTRV